MTARPTPQQRAQMAAFIDRTQPGLLDELGIEEWHRSGQCGGVCPRCEFHPAEICGRDCPGCCSPEELE